MIRNESLAIATQIRRMAVLAFARYNGLYDNNLYTRATTGRTVVYSNALIDQALAICGHPNYRVSFRHWGKDALAFLANFAQEEF